MSTLELCDIRKSYGLLETLKGIDLSLESGEFLVLLGASGCGKSTLLNVISGLLDPTSGDVLLDGRRLNGVHPKDRNIAMVFQSYALYPNLSVARNIGFSLEMRNVPKAERMAAVEEVARMLQIEHLLERKPADLSGGQRQRVAIGRALVRKPKLFLFDEPLSNLDAKLRMEMRNELKRLHHHLGVTVVYVTHDQIEAMTLATRVAVMKDGQIEQLGTPEEIYNRPATLFVAGFIGSPPMNMLKARADNGALRIGSGEARWSEGVPGSAAGRKVIVGVRPEALRIEREPDAIAFKGKVELVGFTGPEKIVTVDVAGDRLVATFPAETEFTRGQPITLYVAPGRCSVFDAKTGKRLESVAAQTV